MANQTINSDAVELGQTQVALSHSNAPRPSVSYNDGAEQTGGGLLAHAVGTLGLLEVWLFIAYVSSGGWVFTSFERVILNNLVTFEAVARVPGVLALCFIFNNRSSTDQSDNFKTITRDQLHNMVYPRSPPRSRKRRDFAAMAWYSLWIASVPIVILLTFIPVWSLSSSDEPLGIRLIPSILAVVAIVIAAVGSTAMESNHSAFVLTVTYTMTKIISLLVLAYGADRLLLGEEDEDGHTSGVVELAGIPLALLQLVKVVSGCVAAVRYFMGRPDENLPKLKGAFRLCCFASA